MVVRACRLLVTVGRPDECYLIIYRQLTFEYRFNCILCDAEFAF